MIKIITKSENEDLWEAALQLGNAICRTDGFEEVCEWKTPYGQHHERDIWLRPGLSIDIHDNKHQQEIGYKHRHLESLPLTLIFHLSGTLEELTYGIRDDYYSMRTGQSYLLSVADTEEIEKYPTGRCYALCIRITPEFLRTLSQGQENSLPAQLKILLECDSSPLLYQPAGKMTLEMKTALRDLLQCPHQGTMKSIYLEAKALELIALQFTQLNEQKLERSSVPTLKLEDINRLHQAKDFLLRRIDQPPSLVELAQQVGLNDYKLKAGFRQVFGTTVFGCLHD